MQELLLIGENSRAIGDLAPYLEKMEPDWTVRKIAYSEGATDYVARRQPGVVVAGLGSDAEAYESLFERVAALSPASIRLALIDQDSPLPTDLRAAHQVLAARDDYEPLRPVLRAAFQVSERSRQHPDLQQIICGLGDVPSPPTLYFDIREQLDRLDGDLEQIAGIVARDPSLVARILKVVNSGLYAMPRSVSDIRQAIGFIGMDALLGLVLAADLYSGLPPPGLKLEHLWQHSIRVSTIARHITQLESGDRDAQSQSAVAGLLHDIGLMVLLANEPARYQPLWQQSQGDESVLAALERETFGVTHGELGAFILMLWSLPDPIVKAVAQTHAPTDAFVAEPEPLSVTSRAVLAGEWLVDSSKDADVPDALRDTPQATLERWREIRDEVEAGEAPI